MPKDVVTGFIKDDKGHTPLKSMTKDQLLKVIDEYKVANNNLMIQNSIVEQYNSTLKHKDHRIDVLSKEIVSIKQQHEQIDLTHRCKIHSLNLDNYNLEQKVSNLNQMFKFHKFNRTCDNRAMRSLMSDIDYLQTELRKLRLNKWVKLLKWLRLI